jgi:hypothetical protein
LASTPVKMPTAAGQFSSFRPMGEKAGAMARPTSASMDRLAVLVAEGAVGAHGVEEIEHQHHGDDDPGRPGA